jgi:hypothetical protein
LSTRRSNVIDLEYLYYAPFCKIFSTGDKFLTSMASMVLSKKQSLVQRDDLAEALGELAARRELKNASATANQRSHYGVEPDLDSLIYRLWQKHVGKFVPQTEFKPISAAQSAEAMKAIKPFLDAVKRASPPRSQNVQWPI